jgi:hypothetical protein
MDWAKLGREAVAGALIGLIVIDHKDHIEINLRVPPPNSTTS